MIVAYSLSDLVDLHQVGKIALAFGVFDGVHRGHQKILDRMVQAAESRQAVPVVMTFSPHPRAVVNYGSAPPLLADREQQLELFADRGVRAVVIVDFKPSVAALSASDFLSQYVFITGLKVVSICVGRGWRFGAGGQGNTALLEQAGRRWGSSVISVPEFNWYGLPVSSTRIREKIQNGKLASANRMLGRFHALRGRVVHGRGIGADRFKCPTANLAGSKVIAPVPGVYAAYIVVDTDMPWCRRTIHPAAVYVGSAPTVSDDHSKAAFFIECHIFDFNEDLYNREIEVQFIEYIRADRVFPDRQSLLFQIHQDLDTVRRLFE